MNYSEALQYISSLEPRGWRLGLDRMEEFMRRSGSLHGLEGKFIHVAGTNGKGSTTAMLQSVLFESGLRTGAFFSPFVVEPRERVQSGREFISEQDLVEITEYLIPIAESLDDSDFGGVTEFEFKTAIGFEYWRRRECDWIALEVGLGGRLDATNVVQPASCAIVSIGYDHMHILGNTLEEIAAEKAGILKPRIPAVIGQMAPGPRQVIEEIAASIGAPLWRVGIEVQYEPLDGGSVRVTTPKSQIELTPSLFGQVQLHNAAVAYSALELAGVDLDPSRVQLGFAAAVIPGRFQSLEFQGSEIVLDGAHNVDSARVLRSMIEESGKHFEICITGMLLGHEPEPFYQNLMDKADEFWVVGIDFHRTRSPQEVAQTLEAMGGKCRIFQSVPEALAELARVVKESGTEGDSVLRGGAGCKVLVTGSFYLVGEVTRTIKDV